MKLVKKRHESSNRNYYIISPRVIIKAIIIIQQAANATELTLEAVDAATTMMTGARSVLGLR